MRAQYLVHKVENNIVFIIDQDGRRSITNDAEAVVEHVNWRYPSHRIIYKDSEGCWDEMIQNNGEFVQFKFLTNQERKELGLV